MSTVTDFEANSDVFMEAVADEVAGQEKGESDEIEDQDTFEDIDEDDSDSTDEDDGEDDSEDSDDPDEEEDDETEEKPQKKTEDESHPIKSYKATLEDGTQVELKDNTSLKLKVDGKYKRVTIKDLKDNYNGNVKHDELIRRSSAAEKASISRLSQINAEASLTKERTEQVSKAITSGNVMEALSVIAQLQGEDPSKVMDAWVNGLTSFLEDFESKTPEQRASESKRYKLDAEIKAKEQRLAKLTETDAEKQARVAVENACIKHDLSKQELAEAHQALINRNKTLEAGGQKPVNFFLEDVVTLALDYQAFAEIQNAAEDLNVKLEQKEINYLLALAKAQEKKNGARLIDKDYIALINKYADKEIKTLSRKVGAKIAKTSPKKNKKQFKEVKRDSQIWDI